MDLFLSNNIEQGSFTNWNQQKAHTALHAMGVSKDGSSTKKDVFPSITGLNKTTESSPSDKILFNITKSTAMSSLHEHPSWKCRRVGCSGFLTLLGTSVNGHIDNMTLSRSRAVNKRSDFPDTYQHGSPLTCSCCGDRPKPEKGGRRAAWQRLCIVCGEPYAMNGFWTKHGGCNRRGTCVPLERRSHGHMNKMRKNFKTVDDMICLPATMKNEKKWIALAMTGRIDRETHDISDSAIQTFEDPPEMSTKTSKSIYSQLMRNINHDTIVLGQSRKGHFNGRKVGQTSTRNAVSFQLSAEEQLKHLEESNLAMSGQHIAFRRKRTTIKKHKKNKRSRSDLELNGHDDKMDGVRVVVCTHELRRSSDSHSTHTLHIARKWIQMQHTYMYTDTRPTWS